VPGDAEEALAAEVRHHQLGFAGVSGGRAGESEQQGQRGERQGAGARPSGRALSDTGIGGDETVHDGPPRISEWDRARRPRSLELLVGAGGAGDWRFLPLAEGPNPHPRAAGRTETAGMVSRPPRLRSRA
jgi:hypothetical protein